MELSFSSKDLEFRDEVRDFLANEYPNHVKEKLENGEVDLEESVKLYEEGMNLKKACEEKLKSIESQIKKIKQENNKVTKEDFK